MREKLPFRKEVPMALFFGYTALQGLGVAAGVAALALLVVYFVT